MARDALDRLKDTLLATPAEAVRKPDIPVAIHHQEAHDLLAFVSTPAVTEKLTAVGLSPDILAAVPDALAASQEAEALWSAAYAPRKPEEQAALEERGRRLRSDVAAAFRWNLRGDREAQGSIDRVLEGTGVADLIQDLIDLAVLTENHAGAFSSDKTFDPSASASAARELAAQIRRGVTDYRINPELSRTVDLRDRAWTHLDDLVDAIREAGRYAFRGSDDVRRFGSAYERRRRLASKRKAGAALPEAETPTP